MIIDALIEVFVTGCAWLLSLLPGGQELDIAAISAAWSSLSGLNYFLPIAEVCAAVAAVLAVGPAFLVARLTTWVAVGVIRGGSASA